MNWLSNLQDSANYLSKAKQFINTQYEQNLEELEAQKDQDSDDQLDFDDDSGSSPEQKKYSNLDAQQLERIQKAKRSVEN